jgi:hypothetical protein
MMMIGAEAGPETRRPLWMSDVLILMAALAVALAWDRGRMVDPTRWISYLKPGPRGVFARVAMMTVDVVEFLPAVLTVGSITVLGLRLRRPRPSLWRIGRQPGAVACAVATLLMVPATLAMLASHASAAGSPAGAWRRTMADLQPENLRAPATMIGFAVAVTWAVLIARRWWEPEPSWVDRLGCLLGVGWLLMIVGGLIVPLLHIAGMS